HLCFLLVCCGFRPEAKGLGNCGFHSLEERDFRPFLQSPSDRLDRPVHLSVHIIPDRVDDFDFLLFTGGIHENADALVRCRGTFKIEQDRVVIELDIASHGLMLFVLDELELAHETRRRVDRLTLVDGLENALTSLGLARALHIDNLVEVHLAALVPDVLIPDTNPADVDALGVTGRDELAIDDRMVEGRWAALERLVGLLNLRSRVQYAVHDDVIGHRRGGYHDDLATVALLLARRLGVHDSRDVDPRDFRHRRHSPWGYHPRL